MSSEENENKLIISNTGGLIRKMDHQLELMNRVLGEIAERKTEIIAAGDSFIGMRAGEERDWQIAPGVKMTFCWIPAGEFLMGSPDMEDDRFDDEDQVNVTLSNEYWMGKYQVTQAQWEALMGSNPSRFKGANMPVEKVSWDDAQGFIKKVNGSGVIPDGWKMALPTEAQWEYACRAGEAGPYSGGSIDQVAWYKGNSESKTHAVGTKKPNAWGLYDMHGNVREWCEDWYDDTLAGGPDPSGASSGVYRVERGGSWYSKAAGCRAARRHGYPPNFHLGGFRPALVPYK
jgi:formylglycine-generating enzyme required for sulfatase activity